MSNTRYNLIDVIKSIAIFAVICLHTNPFLKVNFSGFNGFYITFIIDTLSRFAVPYFFVVSGFLFGKKMLQYENQKQYFIRYITKIIRIYLFWTAFYFIYFIGRALLMSNIRHRDFQTNLIPEGSMDSIIDLISKIFYFGYSAYHLWYLITLIWSIFVLFLFVKYKKVNYLLILSLLLNIIGLFGDSYKGLIYLSITARSALFFGLFYCTLGYYFALFECQIRERVENLKLSFLGITFVIFSILLLLERAYLMKYFHGTINNANFFISNIPMTISLFLLVIKKWYIGFNTIFAKIGQNSLGIYVIHIAILDSLTTIVFGILNYNPHTILNQALLTPIVFFSSYFINVGIGLLKEKIKDFFKYARGDSVYREKTISN